MYQLGIGDFQYDNLENHYESRLLYWILFLLASVISNIIFLNVLIAIISDVYARINEGRERYGLMTRTSIYADFIPFTPLRTEMTRYRYLYMATPVHIEDDPNNDWQGSLHSLKDSVKKNFRKLQF